MNLILIMLINLHVVVSQKSETTSENDSILIKNTVILWNIIIFSYSITSLSKAIKANINTKIMKMTADK